VHAVGKVLGVGQTHPTRADHRDTQPIHRRSISHHSVLSSGAP
jgi:hypothetical protein